MTERRNRRRGDLRWPSQHGWALIGFFAVTFYTLHMIEKNPALLAVPSFMQFIGGLASGGILLAAAWLYAGVKQPESGPPQQVTVTNPPGDPVHVTEE